MYHLYYDKEGVDLVKNTIPRNDEFWKKYHPVETDFYAENGFPINRMVMPYMFIIHYLYC
jgi:hypothetical protein